MANKQNRLAAIFGALNLVPYFTGMAQASGGSNEDKHSSVANAIAAVISIGGAIVEANNPLYKPLIDTAIQTAVAVAKQDGFTTAPPQVAPAADAPPAQPDPQSSTGA